VEWPLLTMMPFTRKIGVFILWIIDVISQQMQYRSTADIHIYLHVCNLHEIEQKVAYTISRAIQAD